MAAAVNNLPALQKYTFPISSLSPDTKENIVIGKKIHNLTDFDKYKHIALAALAIGTIFLVGSMFAFSTGLLGLSTGCNYAGLALAMTGSIYFVVRHFFNPYSKIDAKREKIRSFPLERVLEDSLENIEGYDLLKKAIEDKTQDPQLKTKFYLTLRKLKRNWENIASLKKRFEQDVEKRYLETQEDFEQKKDRDIKAFCLIHPNASSQQVQTEIRVITREYKKALENWQGWKKDSMADIKEGNKTAVDKLEVEYKKKLDGLGKPLFNFKFW